MGTKTQKLSNVVDQIVEWQSVFTGDGSTGLTAVAGRGYFIDTTSGTVTVTLPASPKAGDIVQLKDYARTWGTNAVTISSTTFDGVSNNPSFSTNGQTVTLVYMDGTKGWSLINEDTTTGLGATYVAATGGTVTTSGDYKIHTFTGDGCFVVSNAGNPAGSSSVDYLVVGGGGSGAAKGPGDSGGGGGAGGFRYSADTFSVACSPAEPLKATSGLPVSAQTYPVTVGGGGAGNPAPGGTCAPNQNGANGSNSTFSTITSAGGGRGGYGAPRPNGSGFPGGSGGGAGSGLSAPEGPNTGGSGNTPPVSPPQGNNGGLFVYPGSPPNSQGAGGGGATAVGDGGPPVSLHPGGAGAGVPTAFGCNGVTNPSPDSFRYYAGGGGGGRRSGSCTSGGLGGGGGSGGPIGGSGTANTGGGGGGGAGDGAPAGGGSGGKGIVVIRYKFQ